MILTCLACCFTVQVALAQQFRLTGSVRDPDGEPIPFATVYLQHTNIGTAANSEGDFLLRVPAGNHRLLVRAVGYQQTVQPIAIDQDRHVDAVLTPASFQLEEVVVGNAEDPAYRIIRLAMQKRRTYLEDATPYSANVYIKGVQRLLQAPSSFLGVDVDRIGREIGLDSNRTGIVYLSESESHITVHPPNAFREEMRSSKISGNNRAFSFNRASDLRLNFYENTQTIVEGLSPRPFVSPIADNAMAYYRYRYLGRMDGDSLSIHKIEVIPRRKGEPVYAGDLYIIDGSWRIHSINLMLTKDASINLLDTLVIKQEFIPISESQWHPAQVNLDFVGGLLGFRIGGYFVAVFSDYTLRDAPSPKVYREVLRIEAGANEKDSAYWGAHRPLALTEEEALDYVRKDRIRRRRESKPYLDSLDRETNRFKPAGFLLTGHQHRNRYRRTTLAFDGLANSLLYNSVEGFTLNYGVRYSKQVDTLRRRSLAVVGNLRYGFANERLNGHGGVTIPINWGQVSVSGGSQVSDLNRRGSLPAAFNTINTWLLGRNYQKLHERRFVQVDGQFTLPANIQIDAGVHWEDRQWLPNSTDYVLFSRYRRHITSNNPFTPDSDTPLFNRHQAFLISLALAYDFGTAYETYPHRRVYLPSKYPKFRLIYTKGVPQVLGSDVDYDLLRAELGKENIRLGLYGNISFLLSGGAFLNENAHFYPDLHHFEGTKTLVTDQRLSSLLLLDYYLHSTAGRFAEAHAEYNMATMLTSKVPLLRRLRLQEILGFHYLNTPTIRHYGEVHGGIQWNNIRVMYARSLGIKDITDKPHAIRIGLRLPFN